MIINKDTFVHIEEGIDIYLIEYILLYHFDCYYANSGDPHQDTEHKTGELSDGHFHFLLYHQENDNKLYISSVHNAESINGDYYFDDKKFPVIMGSKLLRKYKINKIQTKIKKLCTH